MVDHLPERNGNCRRARGPRGQPGEVQSSVGADINDVREMIRPASLDRHRTEILFGDTEDLPAVFFILSAGQRVFCRTAAEERNRRVDVKIDTASAREFRDARQIAARIFQAAFGTHEVSLPALPDTCRVRNAADDLEHLLLMVFVPLVSINVIVVNRQRVTRREAMRGIHRILEILFGSAFRIDGQSGGITGIVTVAVPAGAACRDSVKSCGMGCFKNLCRSPVVRQTFVFVPAGAGDIETVGFLHAFRTFCKVNVVFPEYGSGKAADFRVFRRLFRQRPETP